LGRGLKEYEAYHAWYNIAWWKKSFGVHKGGIAKAYGKDSKCSNILVICYFKMGSKMQNVGDRELEFPIHWLGY
jgi:hypothetical protein